MVKLIYIAFAFMILQGLFAYFQINNYRKTVGRLKNKGIMSIGIQKGKLKAGRIVIIVCDDYGKIIEAEQMYGITTFARFKKMKEIEGKIIFQLKENLISDKKKNIALINAIEKIENVLVNKHN
ncbi:transcriptional regulator [Caloramator sp. E03]|uniref:transcriptional regulator GutM n=1 Tax=Caloramator sp. E03 TaxID=2576307 RepID=UPI00111013A6|nr:transcriptional regulator GutM [Caloramator sp. E03]QCX34065.1 transcriptional regulator [Caloramator sp. E03]